MPPVRCSAIWRGADETATYSDPPASILDVEGKGLLNCLVAEGCAVLGGTVRRSVLGRNVVVHRGCTVVETIANDGAEIGQGAQVRRAILDKGAVVPRPPLHGARETSEPGSRQAGETSPRPSSQAMEAAR